MEHETAGDPESGCNWTRKTTGKIAQQLKPAGIRVSANTLGRLLKQLNYSLRLNLKCLESGQRKPPDPRQRDLQFRYIRSQIRSYKANAMPVISVDTKSRELIGPFHQAGRKWSQFWKQQLQIGLCERFGLQVKVCHYPPGSSKWNPIEHRMFSYISNNWAARPLLDYKTVLKFIRTTKTTTGFKIRAFLNNKHYSKGKKVSDKLMRQIGLKRYTQRPNWNYSISPSKK
jgi:hypothetical protein